MSPFVQVWSPYGLAFILQQLILGAVGELRKELMDSLGLKDGFDFKLYHDLNLPLLNSYTTANGMFVTKRIMDSERYQSEVAEIFGTEVFPVGVRFPEACANDANR